MKRRLALVALGLAAAAVGAAIGIGAAVWWGSASEPKAVRR